MARTFAALAAALAFAPAVAFAQTAAEDFARGRDLRTTGKPAEAATLLERAAQSAPQDADIWLNLGLAYAATHDYAKADAALQRALALAPDYPDVQLAYARVAWFRGDRAEAERRLAPLQRAHPDNAEAAELAARIAAAQAEEAAAWRLDASLSRATFSNGLPDAIDAIVALTRRLDSGLAVTGSLEQVRQFGRSDTYVELVGANAHGYLAVGATPDADFRPEVALRGGLTGLAWTLGGAWRARLGLDAAWSRYPVGDVRSLHPFLALERGEAVQLQARWINVLDERDEHQSGYALGAEWQAAPRLRLSLGWADAPESSEGVTAQVQALSAGAAFDVTDNLTLRLVGAHEARDVYDRDELTLALTRRF